MPDPIAPTAPTTPPAPVPAPPVAPVGGAPVPPVVPPVTPPAAPVAPAVDPKAPPAPVAAEFKLSLPDTVKGDDPLLSSFTEIAKAAGFKSEDGQKVVDLWLKANQDAHAKAVADVQAEQAAWTKAIETDKDLGGANLPQSKALAEKTMAQFASPELRTFLNEQGLGNHPELVRFAVAVGKALAEDTVQGTTPTSGTGGSDEQLRKLYPSMFKQE